MVIGEKDILPANKKFKYISKTASYPYLVLRVLSKLIYFMYMCYFFFT